MAMPTQSFVVRNRDSNLQSMSTSSTSSADHLLQKSAKVDTSNALTPSTQPSEPDHNDTRSLCDHKVDGASERYLDDFDDSPLPVEVFEEWQREHDPTGDCARRAVLAHQFCTALAIFHWPACRVLLTAMRMLTACNYDMDDIEVVFAHALTSARSDTTAKLLARMGQQEKVLVSVLILYFSHSLVLDEFVHFRVWHHWMLEPFCSLQTASSALKRVCVFRKWGFSVTECDLKSVLAELGSDAGSRMD